MMKEQALGNAELALNLLLFEHKATAWGASVISFGINCPLQFEATCVLVRIVDSINVPDAYHEVHDWQEAKIDLPANNNII